MLDFIKISSLLAVILLIGCSDGKKQTQSDIDLNDLSKEDYPHIIEKLYLEACIKGSLCPMTPNIKDISTFEHIYSYNKLVITLPPLDIDKLIIMAIDHNQATSGAFMQFETESYVRSALFISHVIKLFNKIEEGNKLKVKLSIDRTLNWMKENPPIWAGNHILAGLNAFDIYQKEFNSNEYDKTIEKIKTKIEKDYVWVNSAHGYFPEAPISWKNRLRTPYIQTQLTILSKYIKRNPNSKLNKFYISSLRFFKTQMSSDYRSISVLKSYDYVNLYKTKGVDDVDIIAPLIVSEIIKHTEPQLDQHFYEEILKENLFKQMINGFINDGYITLYTDLHLRL